MPFNLNARAQMTKGTFARGPQAKVPTPAQGSRYQGANTDRQRRFDSRSERRWGNWGLLGVPTALLWMDPFAPLVCDPFDEACEPAVAVVNPWG